jgi:RNA polymerase sigma factor (sigma-70 family)
VGIICSMTTDDVAIASDPVTDADSRGAIESLYRSHFVRFVRVAAAITGDDALAHDAVQDAFAIALRRHHGLRRRASIEGWVWKIVVNEARQQRRRATRRRDRETEPEGARNVAGPSATDPDASVRRAIAALPERQRTALFLRHYADLGYPQIAQALGVRVGTVSATLNAARTSMRRLLEEDR